MMRYVQPDRFDVNVILEGTLRGCPFCGYTIPAIINRVNETSEIYRSIISCSKCDAQAAYNARDLDEARHGAINRWNTRVQQS
jgi:Lar family restriction alleviation protein